ncbi:hypothetical protein A7D00_6013 [Trichophyton violaceum]|uniref:Integral membrane protein n=1 Tax=Trichophyton violaceum TaxID=34388 RepID=A0A178FD51_TRIVO|nr:hypothetical protein A7D00_6013 [Trichophyton violaceum]
MSSSPDMAHGPPGKPGIEAHGPPYPPPGAGLGGRPTLSVDVAVSAFFIAIFLAGAVSHFTLFRKNLKRNYKFIPSAATGGFCIARIVANTLRIVWAAKPMNINVAIAAQVFVAAGVLILFVINLRNVCFVLAIPSWDGLVQYHTPLKYSTSLSDHDLQLFGGSLLTFVAFLPIPILAFIHLAPQRQPRDQFGSGSWSAKVIIVTAAALLLTLGAGFRIGVSASPIRAATNPAWYHHKACFYVFNFVLEAMVVFIFLFGRVDRRFFVPNGSSKVRNYSDNRIEPKTSDNDEEGQSQVVIP